jgi:HPt (histidine-containing phosphotransfer) domain-containing protein
MSAEDWNSFSRLLEGMGDVEQAVQIILQQCFRTGGSELLQEQLAIFAERFPSLLSELENAMERDERVAAGDLVKYELGELFQQLEQSIQSRVVA